MDMAHMISDFKADASAPRRTVVDGQKPKWKVVADCIEGGMTVREAAKVAGTTYGSARVMLWTHRNDLKHLKWKRPVRAKEPLPPPQRAPRGSGKGETVSIRLRTETAKALQAEADRRGMTRNRLIAKVLTAVTKDKLFDAVMEGDNDQE